MDKMDKGLLEREFDTVIFNNKNLEIIQMSNIIKEYWNKLEHIH